MKCYVVYYSYALEEYNVIDVVFLDKEEAEQYVQTMTEQEELIRKKNTEIYYKMGEIEEKYEQLYPNEKDEELMYEMLNKDKEYKELEQQYDCGNHIKCYFMKEVDLIG